MVMLGLVLNMLEMAVVMVVMVVLGVTKVVWLIMVVDYGGDDDVRCDNGSEEGCG